MSEESKSVYMPYYELVRISLDAAQRIGSEIELHHGGLIKLFKEIDALNARIAELEAFVGKLIEVGHKSVNFVEGFCNTYGNEKPKYWHDWKALEDDWKERER